MAQNSTNVHLPLASWYRYLLMAAAIFTVLLIAMGGILCVTQSIRNCPDWPGCFGKVVPPTETGPILEYTHRLLAAISGLLILSSAIAGLVRTPRLYWISIPPLVAVALLVEVSYFGAQVVLRGLAPGWAAVDVGSALLVVTLMVSAALIANAYNKTPSLPVRLTFHSSFAKLLLSTIGVIYVVLISGILVAGKASVTACLGWPIYSLNLFKMDMHPMGNTLRLILSIAGIGMVVAAILQAWSRKKEQPVIFTWACLAGAAFLIEVLIQLLLLVYGNPVLLLVLYTCIAALFWALLVALVVRTGLQDSLN